MKRIRIGNDFTFVWSIERAGVPENLEQAENVRLVLVSLRNKRELTDYRIIGNVVSIDFTPEILTATGEYMIELYYSLPDSGLTDGERQCAVDTKAFEIVARTAQADDVSEIAHTSETGVGLKGDKGDPFTYDDFTSEQIEGLKVKGDPFTYEDFTPEQIEALKVKGDPFTYEDFTPEQIEGLKVKGDPFVYDDFTPEQIEGLKVKGDKGDKGDTSDNLLYEFNWNLNAEYHITSIDFATNTFTCVNHGLANGVVLGLAMNKEVIYPFNVIPFDFTNPNACRFGLYVVNKTTDTFQVSLTSGGNPITLVNRAHDLTKWHFENAVGSKGVEITDIDVTRGFRVVAEMRTIIAGAYYIGDVSPDYIRMLTGTFTNPALTNQAFSNIYFGGVLEYKEMNGNNGAVIKEVTTKAFKIANSASYGHDNYTTAFYKPFGGRATDKVRFNNFYFANGANIKIYKI